ncbi:hypothetical protein GCM10010972_28000 [Cellulomonas carbonis]|nr:hypothetical protein GCM10010972_28000 [Cellulomonas carbonis]
MTVPTSKLPADLVPRGTGTTAAPPGADLAHLGGAPGRRGRTRTAGSIVAGTLGAVGGVAPHVLHHVGPLVGTALVSGAGGTALFGLLGLGASVPMLIRLKRRVGSWWAPVVALAAFALMFMISSLVVGPWISGTSDPTPDEVTVVHDDGHHD